MAARLAATSVKISDAEAACRSRRPPCNCFNPVLRSGRRRTMSDAAAKPWTVDQFFAWQSEQGDRYELVGGFPVRMMAGAKNVHDDIVVNVLAELRRQLRGSGCRPFAGDGSVETISGQIRRPDAGVDRGRRDPDALKAASPRLLVEVLSPTTRDSARSTNWPNISNSTASPTSSSWSRTRRRSCCGLAARLGLGGGSSPRGSDKRWRCPASA